MERFALWIAKHRRLCQIVALLFWVTIQFIFLVNDIPSWLVTLVVVFALTITFGVINTAPAASLKNEIKLHTEQCDPYPMINAIPTLLQYRQTELMCLCLNLDYCNAMNNAGHFQEAWRILTQINIDKSVGTPLNLKVIYYLSLYESCVNLGMYEQAYIGFDKAISIYNDMKENKAKKAVREIVIQSHADMALRHNDPDTALSVLSTSQDATLLALVLNKLLIAKCLVQKGDISQARTSLLFVIQNGNKLHAVRIANDILMKL